MSVEMPFRMRFAVGRLLVKTHGIREGRVEQAVVAGCELLQNVSQVAVLLAGQFRKVRQVLARQNHGFERPDRPERYEHRKVLVLKHDALSRGALELTIVTE